MHGSLLLLPELPGSVPFTQPVPGEPCPGLLLLLRKVGSWWWDYWAEG